MNTNCQSLRKYFKVSLKVSSTGSKVGRLDAYLRVSTDKQDVEKQKHGVNTPILLNQ